MAEFEEMKKLKSIGRFTVSFISVCFTQFSLFLVSYSFPSSSFHTLFLLSLMALVVVAGVWRLCTRFLKLSASAPAFVFLNTFFIWFVYFLVVRQAISSILDIAFNSGLTLLVIGLYSILSCDPGSIKFEAACLETLVSSPSDNGEAHPESLNFIQRIRYCKKCNVYVKGFDHHCPAFGNCIGQNNHVLFIVLLAGFLISETFYIACSSQIAPFVIMVKTGRERQTSLAEALAVSTLMFSLLQVLWQVVFLMWHIYCICFNIRTEEWIHWKRYPEFQNVVHSQPGQPVRRFTNPYDKGVVQNLKEFLKAKG